MRAYRTVMATALLAMCSGGAWAQTSYTFNSPPLTTVISDGSTCSIGDCGINHANTDRITGTVTLGPTLPANFNGNLVPYLVSYSFTDGHRTIASSDTLSRINDFTGTTNASGVVTGISFNVQRRWNAAIGTGTTNPNARLNMLRYYSGPGALAAINAYCTAWNSEVCTTVNWDSHSEVSAGSGVASVSAMSAAPVPTLTEWAMIALTSLLALFGAAHAIRSGRTRA